MEKKKQLFLESILDILEKNDDCRKIGVLKEKTVHAVLKRYLEPDTKYHEVKVGSFYADIMKDKRIFEVQTGSFNYLRKKLNLFLKNYEVTICYPIIHTKYLVWLKDGQENSKRKSPKTGNVYQIYPELYKIKNLLTNSNLHLQLILFDAIEYRELNGWDKTLKRGSTRIDYQPMKLVNDIFIKDISEYYKIIPDLNDLFTNEDFKNNSKLSISKARIATNVLCSIGVIKKYSKDGNKIIYMLT